MLTTTCIQINAANKTLFARPVNVTNSGSFVMQIDGPHVKMQYKGVTQPEQKKEQMLVQKK